MRKLALLGTVTLGLFAGVAPRSAHAGWDLSTGTPPPNGPLGTDVLAIGRPPAYSGQMVPYAVTLSSLEQMMATTMGLQSASTYQAGTAVGQIPVLGAGGLLPDSVMPLDVSATVSKVNLMGTAAGASTGTSSGQVPVLGANGLLADSTMPTDVTTAVGLAGSALQPTSDLSSNIADPAGAFAPVPLAVRFARKIEAADKGVTCDGATDNYAAIMRVIAAVNASPGGALVEWPGGSKCVVFQQVTATITKNVRFVGQGPIDTYFYFTGQTSNGFHLYSGAGASIEWEETGIDTGALAPADDGLLIEGANTGGLPHNNAGWVVVDHNQIQGNFWAGLHLRNLNFATASYNRITASGGPAVTAAYPSPNNLTPDPVASIIGSSVSATAGTSVGTAGIFLEGSGSDYLIDPKLVGNSIVNGTAQIEMDDTQGGYMTANSLFNGIYGLRSTCATNMSCENLTFTSGYVFDALDDFYLEGMSGFQIVGNFMWVTAANSAAPPGGNVGVFVRGGNGGVVSGNTIQAPGHLSGKEWAWFVGNDALADAPWVFGPNSIFGGGGPMYIGNDSNTSGVSAQNNNIVQAAQPASGSSVTDATMTASKPFGSNGYINNSTPYGDMNSDGQGNIALRRGLRCGGPYDTCTLTQTVNGQVVFSSDASGNIASAGSPSFGGGGGLWTGSATGYAHWEGSIAGTIPANGSVMLTPAGGAIVPVPSAASGGQAATTSPVVLPVAAAAGFTVGWQAQDNTTGVVLGTVTSASGTSLGLSGLAGAVTTGDVIAPVLPAAFATLPGAIVNNGTFSFSRLSCFGPTPFILDGFQQFRAYNLGTFGGESNISVAGGGTSLAPSMSISIQLYAGKPIVVATQTNGPGTYECGGKADYQGQPN